MKNFLRRFLLFYLIFNYSLSETLPYRNLVYYGEWSVYNDFNPSNMDAKSLTHINFAFIDMDSNGDLKLCDEYADFQIDTIPEIKSDYPTSYIGLFGAFSVLKIKNPHLKLGVSVGGWTKSGDFPGIAKDKVKRQNFASNIAKFVDYVGFDLVDIDWEHPTVYRDGNEWDEGCPGSAEDTENFTLLMKELRNELDKLEQKNGKHYELSIAMSAEIGMLKVIEYDKVLQLVDFVNLMTYDLAGSWNSYTSHQTPLYTNDAYNHQTMYAGNSVDAAIKYFQETYGNSIDYKKILIGVAAYTRGWAGVKDDGLDKNNPGLFATANPNSVVGPDGSSDGSYDFSDYDKMIKEYDLVEYFDNTAKAAYYYSPTKGYFFTGDNEESVRAKGKYVKENELGGLFMWMASQDRNNKLTKAMFNSLFGDDYTIPEQKLIYSVPKIDIEISAIENGYQMTITNLENRIETNNALQHAESLYQEVINFKLYITTKSKSEFNNEVGKGYQTVTNENGVGIIDFIYEPNPSKPKTLPPGRDFVFSVGVSGTPNVNDITSIKMTQKIFYNLNEFKEQIIYQR